MSARLRHRAVTRLLGGAVLVFAAWVSCHAGIIVEKPGGNWAVLIDGGAQSRDAVADLAQTLKQHYGFESDHVITLSGDQVTGEAVRNTLYGLPDRVRDSDQLFVYLGLPSREGAGQELILTPPDYRESEPWSAISVRLLQELAGAMSSRNSWWILASCTATPDLRDLGSKQASFTTYERRAIGMYYCIHGDPGADNTVTRTLAAVLRELAAERSPGIVPGQLAKLVNYRSDGRISITLAPSEDASNVALTLPLAKGSLVSELNARLSQAETVQTKTEVFAAAVSSTLQPSGADTTESIASFLANVALGTEGSESEDVRDLAVQALGDLRADVAMQTLDRIYQQATSPRLRRTAVIELAALPNGAGVASAQLALNDPDPTVQAAAVSAVSGNRDAATVTAIKARLGAEQPPAVRLAAIRSAAEVLPPADLEPLLFELLVDAQATVRAEAVVALGRLKAPSAQVGAHLLALLEADTRVEVREAAAYAMAESVRSATGTQRESLVAGLIRASRTAKPEVRYAAMWTLAHGGATESRSSLAAIVADSAEPLKIRSSGVEALGDLGDPSVVPTIAGIARDHNNPEQLRVTAAMALGQFNQPDAVAALFDLFPDRASDVGATAIRYLGDMKVYSTFLVDAVRDETLNTRKRVLAAGILGRSGNADAIPALLRATTDAEAVLSEASVTALSQFKQPAAVARIGTALLTDPNARIRASAADALGAIGTREAQQALVAAVADRDPGVRAKIALALAQPNLDARAVRAVLRLSTDALPDVRRAAARALGASEHEDARKRLQSLTRDPSEAVRAAAIEALRVPAAIQRKARTK